ncbi:MAG: helix-turn-helix domain-containing protein, partial [Ectothiorhodospiraceae bacterium]|nr:helix-turn-helix domain-containing protein [Ectothiorhodospiraceae bacterium]
MIDSSCHRVHARNLVPKVTFVKTQKGISDNVTIGSMSDENRTEFAQRLNEALDDAGFPSKGAGRQVSVGKRFGVSQKAARKWLEGEGIPKTSRLMEIATELRIHFEWLLSGRGPKRTEPEDDKHHSSDAATDSRLEYLLLYASPRSREALKRIAQ